jgi:hypothetical protein
MNCSEVGKEQQRIIFIPLLAAVDETIGYKAFPCKPV